MHVVSCKVAKMSDINLEGDLKLIKSVQKIPWLYDRSNFQVFRNNVSIMNTWTKISQELKIPREYCITRWKYLRKRYSRSPHSKWNLTRHLNFLEPFIHRKSKKKDNCDLPNDCTSISSEVKETGNQHSITTVLPKPSTPLKLQKKSIKQNASVTSIQTPPNLSLILEKQSNQSFCESLSNDFQILTADEQIKCRIDILTIIRKYRNSINNNDLESGGENDNFNVTVSDLCKNFASISDKISKGNMTPFDDDWLLIFSVKNFFCHLLEIRKRNSELDRMLPSFEPINSASNLNEQLIQNDKKQNNFKPESVFRKQSNLMDNFQAVDVNFLLPDRSTAKFSEKESTNILRESISSKNYLADMQVTSQEDDFYIGSIRLNDSFLEPTFKTEPTNVDKSFLLSSTISQEQTFENEAAVECTKTPSDSINGSLPINSVSNASISALEKCLESKISDTLKNLLLSKGLMKLDINRFVCILCDVTLSTDYCNNHVLNSVHDTLMKDYSLKSAYVKETAVPQLDLSIYSYKFGGLYCLKCDARMLNRGNFLSHMKSLKHKKLLKSLPISLDIDMLGDRSIGKGIVKINKSDFCLLCDLKIFENPSIMHAMSSTHRKVVDTLDGIFKMSPSRSYCTYCNDVFPFQMLNSHISQKKHVVKVTKELATRYTKKTDIG